MKKAFRIGAILVALIVGGGDLPSVKSGKLDVPPIYMPIIYNSPGTMVAGCPVFPLDNPWNRDVSQDLVDANSTNYINYILNNDTGHQLLHADFGSDPTYGIPFIVVPADESLTPINFTEYGDESDPGPYPIPLNAKVEYGSDHHVLALHQEQCYLYELYHATPQVGYWNAGSGAKFNLRSNDLRPVGWTSADAAGLPIMPGLMKYDEVASGMVSHAVRFTVNRSQRAYISPATHYASSITDTNAPPMGLRLRLKTSYDISSFTGHTRVILAGLKRYGMIVADNGTSWYISGATDSRWVDDDLNQLKTVPGSAFEVVQTGIIIRP
jgi:hypothetical protein